MSKAQILTGSPGCAADPPPAGSPEEKEKPFGVQAAVINAAEINIKNRFPELNRTVLLTYIFYCTIKNPVRPATAGQRQHITCSN